MTPNALLAALMALAACHDDPRVTADASGADGSVTGRHGYVYVESNDPGGNTLLAFDRAPDGSLVFAHRAYATGGLGLVTVPDQRTGPLDSDRNIAVSPDGTYVYAVNSGDTTIASFRVNANATLAPVAGSPFPSGGANPASIGLAGDFMYVAGKAVDGGTSPSYTVLGLSHGLGRLNADATQPTPIGSSPAIAYVSPDQRFVFGAELLDQLHAFVRAPDGTLRPVPGSPFALDGVALGVIAHPAQPVLYVGLHARAELGVYTYDDAGLLTFVHAVPASGAATCCFVIDAAAKRLYAVSSASATIATYDLADPLAPAKLGSLELRLARSGTPFVDATGAPQTITSRPFQLALDSARAHVYVVSQRVTTEPGDPTGNYLHTLAVQPDGTLAELDDPIDLRSANVPPVARPQGVLVLDATDQ